MLDHKFALKKGIKYNNVKKTFSLDHHVHIYTSTVKNPTLFTSTKHQLNQLLILIILK